MMDYQKKIGNNELPKKVNNDRLLKKVNNRLSKSQ
jgi:hypothetical protein